MAVDAAIRRENLRTICRARGLTPSLAAAQYGRRVSFWSDLLIGRKAFGEKLARAIEEQLGLPPLSLDQAPETAEQHASAGVAPRVAHDLSQFKPEHAPLLDWGALMEATKLAQIFWTTLPDDSMAPRAPAGKRVCFDRGMTPMPGDGVLVADALGAVYFRLYRAGPAGRWTAAALNSAYQDLESERDGLRVLAVLKAEEGRWS